MSIVILWATEILILIFLLWIFFFDFLDKYHIVMMILQYDHCFTLDSKDNIESQSLNFMIIELEKLLKLNENKVILFTIYSKITKEG